MSEGERNELIEFLLMWTMWSRDGLEKLSNRKLLDEFERHNKLNRG